MGQKTNTNSSISTDNQYHAVAKAQLGQQMFAVNTINSHQLKSNMKAASVNQRPMIASRKV